MHLRYPFGLDQIGRLASAQTQEEYIVELMEQVLFTNPGERVNRPDFGCGTLLLVFEPGQSQLSTITSTTIQASLERWMGELIDLQDVTVSFQESELLVTVEFSIIRTKKTQIAEFRRSA